MLGQTKNVKICWNEKKKINTIKKDATRENKSEVTEYFKDTKTGSNNVGKLGR